MLGWVANMDNGYKQNPFNTKDFTRCIKFDRGVYTHNFENSDLVAGMRMAPNAYVIAGSVEAFCKRCVYLGPELIQCPSPRNQFFLRNHFILGGMEFHVDGTRYTRVGEMCCKDTFAVVISQKAIEAVIREEMRGITEHCQDGIRIPEAGFVEVCDRAESLDNKAQGILATAVDYDAKSYQLFDKSRQLRSGAQRSMGSLRRFVFKPKKFRHKVLRTLARANVLQNWARKLAIGAQNLYERAHRLINKARDLRVKFIQMRKLPDT